MFQHLCDFSVSEVATALTSSTVTSASRNFTRPWAVSRKRLPRPVRAAPTVVTTITTNMPSHTMHNVNTTTRLQVRKIFLNVCLISCLKANSTLPPLLWLKVYPGLSEVEIAYFNAKAIANIIGHSS